MGRLRICEISDIFVNISTHTMCRRLKIQVTCKFSMLNHITIKLFWNSKILHFLGTKFEVNHFVSGVLFIEELQAFFYLQFWIALGYFLKHLVACLYKIWRYPPFGAIGLRKGLNSPQSEERILDQFHFRWWNITLSR